MQFHNLFFLGLISIASLHGCSTFTGEENIIKTSSLPRVKNQFTPLIMWSSTVGNGIGNYYSNLHPAFIKGTVYAADRKGIICAFNIDDGKKIWSINLSEKNRWLSRTSALLSGGLTVTEDRIYVGSERGQVYALNTRDGAIVWQARVAGEALSHPVVSEGMVLIHTSNGWFQALNESDGSVKWTINLDAPSLSLRGESAPTVIFGAAIVGSDNGFVSAILMEEGQLIWQNRISQMTGATEFDRLSDVDSSPVIVDGVVYALAYNGNLTALDLRSGQIIWKHNLGSVNDFIIHANRIYLVDQNDRLLALSIKHGVTLWTQSDLLYRFLTTPVLHTDSLAVGDYEGYIHWVDPETGRLIAQKKIDCSGFSTRPLVANGKLLIQAKNGRLYVITR